MRTLEVVPAEPEEESMIERLEIIEEKAFLVVDELLLESAIEALAMGIHFWRVGKGVPVNDVAGLEGEVEVFTELVAVIGEGTLGGDRE